MDFPQPQYNVGDRVYCQDITEEVTITDIQLTAQKQLRYLYVTDKGSAGVVPEISLGDPPSNGEDLPNCLFINMASVTDINAVFPNLPGGKGRLARKIVEAAKETPFDGEINFIERMKEIEPKCDWEEISHRLKYDKPAEIGV